MKLLKYLTSLFFKGFVETTHIPPRDADVPGENSSEQNSATDEAPVNNDDDSRPGYKVRWHH